jgi:hypothetical protein
MIYKLYYLYNGNMILHQIDECASQLSDAIIKGFSKVLND